MFFLVFFILYLLIIGYSTILERKVLSTTQIRKGVFRLSLLNLYHAYLDFLKMVVKGLLKELNLKYIIYLVCLFLILFLNFISFCLLPLNYFGMKSNLGLLIYFILDCSIIFLKIFILTLLKYKILAIFCERIKPIYIFLEGVCLSFYFIVLICILGLDIPSWYLIHHYNKVLKISKAFFFFILTSVVLFFLIISKLFRTPFDYFEIESELTGGGVIEFYGIGFVLWSLVEYSLIFNGAIFFSSFVTFFMTGGGSLFLFLGVFTSLFNLYYFLIFLIRGVLIRIKFLPFIYFLTGVYLVSFLLLFLIFFFISL